MRVEGWRGVFTWPCRLPPLFLGSSCHGATGDSNVNLRVRCILGDMTLGCKLGDMTCILGDMTLGSCWHGE